MRILGKGKTAQAIKEAYPEALMFDDNDIDIYDITSDELTVVSPGIPPSNKLVKSTKNLISEYDLFYKNMPYNIWISGTNGKTTTTSMLQHILSKQNSQCGGNIGTPLANMDKSKNIWILETSSFTLHYTNIAKPNLYILLPISDDHASWHGNFKEYELSKLKPLNNLQEGEIAIVPSKYKDYKTNGFLITYDTSEDIANYFDINIAKVDFDEPYKMDALLALAITKILYDEIDYEKINNFVQDPHKLEKLYDNNGMLWVNDSKATNIDATIQALKSFKDYDINLILGGDDKGANLEPLFEECSKYQLTIYAIGSNTEKINNLANSNKLKCIKCQYLDKAIAQIKKDIQQKTNTMVLLSPAAASLDQFKSYAQRGDEFKTLINESV
jgi:UDP-N-acetylmuramoylalanine--D-glutamate ligase